MRLINVLEDYAPPVLFGKGNFDILNLNSVGFCGSRKSSQASIDAVSKCTIALSSHSINIVSGYAQGIDQAAHSTALQEGGITTIVLATGILHFEVKQSIAPWINENNCLILSEFLPRLGWTVHNAMQRNKTICGLSDAMVIVESSLKGGTFEAGKTALALERPVFVIEYQHKSISPEGNRYFLDNGAKSLRAEQDGGVGVNRLLKTLQDSHLTPGQQKLFD